MLAEPQVPFPVGPDHRVRPDLVRLKGPLFTLDAQYPVYVEAKLEQFSNPWARVIAADANRAAVRSALHLLLKRLEREHADSAWARSLGPPWISERAPGEFDATCLGATLKTDPGDVAIYEAWEPFDIWMRAVLELQEGLDGLERLGLGAALCLQEDMVLMHGTRAEAMWVCLPSRWDPAGKIGLDFAAIHEPVPHSQALQAAQANLARAMSEKGPFERHVWGLTHDPKLCQHPSLPRWDAGDTVFFRTERQVTLPLPGLGRSWFLIRVYNVPLAEVLTTSARKRQLAEALRTMSPEHVAYKHMGHIIPRVLAELEGQ